jgi:hypothetical protein
MGLLDRLFSRGGDDSGCREPSDPHGIRLYVQCDQCGEKIAVRVDKRYDLTRDPSSRTKAFSVHKEILGSDCRNLIRADVFVSTGGKLLDVVVEGAQRITWDDYIGEPEEAGGPETG